MTFATKVQRAIERAGVSVIGLSIGDLANKATWAVSHLPTATQADRNAAATAITNFNETDPAVIADAHTQDATATSRQKDMLATCALIVRARGIPAWNNLSIQQKKDATLAEADVWVNIRNFIEDNL